MHGFFEHRIAFWQAQLIGWGAYCIIWFLVSIPEYQLREATLGVAFVRVVIMTVLGLSISTGLRPIYNWLWKKSFSLPFLVGIIAGISLLSGMLWGVIFELLKWPLNEPSFSGKEWFLFGRGLLASAFLIFAWSVIYIGTKYSRLAKEQRERALRAETMASKAQLQLLQYQLNPHFFFNALNTIRALIDEDPVRAREVITGFSEYIRYAMIDPTQQQLTLGAELASIRAYLDIEKIRFEERLKVSFMLDDAVEKTNVPPFLVHPLVENAIKHGGFGSDGALHVVISALQERDTLQIKVANTGTLYNTENERVVSSPHDRGKGGVGLTNLKQRLTQLFGQQHYFNLYGENGWVYAVIEIR